MKNLWFCLPILIILIITGCNPQNSDFDQEIILTDKAARLIEADNDFGLELYKNVAAHEENADNLMVSPLSVSLALAMTYNGAEGQTKIDMEKTLRLYGFSSAEINQSYQYLVGALKSVDPKVLLEIANSIYYRQDFQVEKAFITTNKNYYKAEVSPLDFFSPGAVDVINGWVDEKTHGKIKTILDRINPDHVMFLLNAIYFRGIWEKEFNPENTKPHPFTTATGNIINAEMMQRLDTLDYSTTDLFSAIRLPYGKGNFNLYVFLPEPGRSLGDIEMRLDGENWKSWMKGFQKTNSVDIKLPKFKFGYEIKLNKILSDMGMEIAFTGAADFTGMNKAGGLRIDYVKHKTFVEVNEEGTEAAAVTIVAIVKTMAGPAKIPFYADKPFLFAITEKDTGAILFIGKVTDPSAN